MKNNSDVISMAFLCHSVTTYLDVNSRTIKNSRTAAPNRQMELVITLVIIRRTFIHEVISLELSSLTF